MIDPQQPETQATPKRRRPRSELALTDATREKIIGYLRIGSDVTIAALAAGIHRDTFYGWCERGRAGEEPFATFLDQVEEARALHEVMLAGHVYAACRGDDKLARNWKQNIEVLARRYPERWRLRDRTEVTGPGGGPIEHSPVTADEVLSRLARIAAQGAERESDPAP
jgi:hypothetical protein